MSEKMKCARCGKRFRQTNKKQVFCAECQSKERAAKKTGPQLVPSTAGNTTSGGLRRPETSAQPSGITIVQATPPPEQGAFGARARSAEAIAPQTPARPPQPEKPAATQAKQPLPTSPSPMSPPHKQPPKKPDGQPTKQPQQPRPTPPPFELTAETRAAIEQRYLELSQPVEFNGIRTRISEELQVPKSVVKQVIKDLRASRQLPSWWELQAYKGNDETLNRIRERYLPLLPVPPIGVHKQIASELQMEAPQVYQAIRRLRAEMKLPQYNPPAAHASETPTMENAGNVATETGASATNS